MIKADRESGNGHRVGPTSRAYPTNRRRRIKKNMTRTTKVPRRRRRPPKEKNRRKERHEAFPRKEKRRPRLFFIYISLLLFSFLLAARTAPNTTIARSDAGRTCNRASVLRIFAGIKRGANNGLEQRSQTRQRAAAAHKRTETNYLKWRP